MAVEKNNSVNNHIDRIKFKSGYSINEASYSLVGGVEEDDELPQEVWNGAQPVTGMDSNVHEDEEENPEENPEASLAPEEEPVEPEAELPAPEEEPALDAMPAPEPEVQEPSVEELQNNIMKKSLSAMEQMNNQLNQLEMSFSSISTKLAELNKDVAEVKEPTQVEKLMARQKDSHPFKYNLNDMWNGSSFQARMEDTEKSGLKQLEDGTFIADFDQLPKYNEEEISDSFK